MEIVTKQPIGDYIVDATYNKATGEVKIDVSRHGHDLHSETVSFNEIQGNVYMALSKAVSNAKIKEGDV